MATIGQAQARISRALDRVEAALQRDGAEREIPANELAQLRRENDSLRSNARTVSERLDGAIARIRALLAE